MSVPSKVHTTQLVQIAPEERLAATSELNLASSLVTGGGEAWRMGYWAAMQVKGLSPYSEAICWSYGCKPHHCNSQLGDIVISGSCWGETTAESFEGLRTDKDDPGMTKTVSITEEGNGTEVCRLADEVAKWRSQDDGKLDGARTSGFRRDSENAFSRLRAGGG